MPDSASLMDYLYGPLNNDYCIYFYILSFIGFTLFIISILSTLIIGITTQQGSLFYVGMFMLCMPYGLLYFHNRLLYSICNGSSGSSASRTI
jgi:uncharacterized membrane protein